MTLAFVYAPAATPLAWWLMFGVGPPLLAMGAVAVTFVTMPPPAEVFASRSAMSPRSRSASGEDASSKDMAFPFQLGEAPQAAAEIVVDARKRTFHAAEVALAVRVVEADGRDGCDDEAFLIVVMAPASA